MVNTDFERIYLNQQRSVGRLRIADSGLGWKASSHQQQQNGQAPQQQQPFLLPREEIILATWSRGSKGYELRVQTKNKGVIVLDGFHVDDFNQLKQELTRNFHISLEHEEHSLRGWNWGKTDLAKNELVFNVNNKPAFEIPYDNISNSNLTGKNEVAIEFNLSDGKTIDKLGDEIVEMRFYVPGTTVESETNTTKKTIKNEDGKEEEEEDEEEKRKSEENMADNNAESMEQNAAQVFYEQLKDKADIGQIAGEAIVSFSDALFLTPRGRYDIDMYSTSLRLRGKTYDYKIQYEQIERIFSLPKPDEVHHLIIIQIDPPLRQGQTRYPFLVLQFARDEETELELNLSDEEFDAKYKNRLKKTYDAPTYIVMAHCLRGLTEKKLFTPGSFQSRFLQPGLSCSLKASEGYLYPLDRCFLFVTKPTLYIPYSEISNVVMSRTGGGVSASRTFDLEINIVGSTQKHVFGSIDREEQDNIERFCKEKGVKVKNEEKIAKQRLAKALEQEAAMDEDDDDGDVDMGSAGEDDSEEDDDFKSGSDSDVAEEFDSDAESSASDSEDGGSTAGDGDDRPPKKKAKN
ncbi:FACT complex subunit [Lodderomyces elongisporus]|uniref:FACT complex subunit n=1 Tax=Lodderomyces elongisporus TaxID=36914 RepID=UPI00291C8996|nr:FACT complex subunit [Lodderomyces elongisporus]WLF77015.1 FACT complex subunit [Lodderomyces elongisporus]